MALSTQAPERCQGEGQAPRAGAARFRAVAARVPRTRRQHHARERGDLRRGEPHFQHRGQHAPCTCTRATGCKRITRWSGWWGWPRTTTSRPSGFLQTMEAFRNTEGNAYALIVPDKLGAIRRLDILDPTRVRPRRHPETGEMWYTVTLDDGKTFPLPGCQLIVVRHMSANGEIGIRPIDVLRGTLDYDKQVKDLSLAQLDGVNHGVFLTVPNTGLGEDERDSGDRKLPGRLRKERPARGDFGRRPDGHHLQPKRHRRAGARRGADHAQTAWPRCTTSRRTCWATTATPAFPRQSSRCRNFCS